MSWKLDHVRLKFAWQRMGRLDSKHHCLLLFRTVPLTEQGTRNAFEILLGKPIRKNSLGKVRMNLKGNWMLTKKMSCELNYLVLYQMILELFNDAFYTVQIMNC